MSDDDAISADGFAKVATEPMPVKIDMTPFYEDDAVKFELFGDDDQPEKGIRAIAFLGPDECREIGERLLTLADEMDPPQPVEAGE
jgi:hypothetical protein